MDAPVGKVMAALLAAVVFIAIAQSPVPGHPVKQLKVTILSTMLADDGIGEWGFAALLETDGREVLVDTGARPETVLHNARELKIDLSGIRDVVLTHFHDDHTGGLMSLRNEMKKVNSAALARVHVAPGIFYSRPLANGGEGNPMIATRQAYQAAGGQFLEHSAQAEILPGVYVTGPIARPNPERNWSGSGKVRTPAGLVEDTVPEDQSVVVDTADGVVVITGCGHAGIVNILTAVAERFEHRPVMAIIGGLHLFAAKDEQVTWTADKLKDFGLRYLIGAHCTGIESLYTLRSRIGLSRQTAVVGAVGATFVSGEGIHAGRIAQ